MMKRAGKMGGKAMMRGMGGMGGMMPPMGGMPRAACRRGSGRASAVPRISKFSDSLEHDLENERTPHSMALTIRLSRGGAKKRPFYRIVVADSRKPRDGRFIERLGHFNPMLPKDNAERVVLKEERIKHWLSVGRAAVDRVHGSCAEIGLAEKPETPTRPRSICPRPRRRSA